MDSTRTYFYCNRTGQQRKTGSGIRQTKTQGSSKMNAHCTACMTVQKTQRDIKVEIYPTHYGHETSLGHLRILETERVAIAAQLAQGVDIQRILDNIRDNLGKEFQRIHLLTKKDIYNIEKTYGLKVAQKHQDDATSVNIWVEEMRSSKGNPVILYKKQGEPQPDDCDNLCNDDLVLAIQTPLQTQILQ